jgi:hypothetical protein
MPVSLVMQASKQTLVFRTLFADPTNVNTRIRLGLPAWPHPLHYLVMERALATFRRAGDAVGRVDRVELGPQAGT